jgi:hypothetical protein
MLSSSPAMFNSASGATIMKEQMDELDKYSNEVKDEKADSRKLKKSIQYNNYKTQKKK